MRILVTEMGADGQRFKHLVDHWEMPPEPTGRQIKTRTIYSGVTNGTERNDLLGGNYATPTEKLPAPWGYQNVGEVVAVGPEVTTRQVGDVIYSSANHTAYAVIEEDWLNVVLPPEVDRKEAALFGMASVAMHTCRHADIRLGEKVLVVGGGTIGQVAAQIARGMGARPTLCELDPKRLALAEEIGACDAVLDVSGEDWGSKVEDFGYDVVIDVAGVPGMEDALVKATAFRGRLLFIAGRGRIDYDFNVGQGHEITIKQNSHFDNDDLENLCRLVARGDVRLGPCLWQVAPVAEARGIYDTLRDRPSEMLGTVFVW